MRRPARLAWIAVAYLSLGIGLVGVVVPVLPTAPFVLLAAYAAARSSPALHARLLGHRTFGPIIGDWQRQGAIGRGPKMIATAMMAASVAIMLLTAPRVLALVATGIVVVVCLWIWTRPEPRAPGASVRAPQAGVAPPQAVAPDQSTAMAGSEPTTQAS
ncbi:MAG: YbaN family protein [Thermoleophilia bacterium]|jgi:hypothetical protein|nr:YbaN family protein [Thermoleophilia bacterium]